jgi:hypothetical protein
MDPTQEVFSNKELVTGLLSFIRRREEVAHISIGRWIRRVLPFDERRVPKLI